MPALVMLPARLSLRGSYSEILDLWRLSLNDYTTTLQRLNGFSQEFMLGNFADVSLNSNFIKIEQK
jgi:hypothetical protein